MKYPDGLTENDYIRRLVILDSNYNDSLDYDLFSETADNRKWWKADDSYNYFSTFSNQWLPYLRLEA